MPHNGQHNGSAAVDLDRPGENGRVRDGRSPCAERVFREALARGLERLRQHDPAVREGDVKGVHGMRTSTRRLRSTLRTFCPLLDGEWARPLEDELKWLAGLLGAVRDLDVLEERLRNAAGKSVRSEEHTSELQSLRHLV